MGRAAVDLLNGPGALAALIVAAGSVTHGHLSSALLPTSGLAAATSVPGTAAADADKELGRVLAAASDRLSDLLSRPALVAEDGEHSLPATRSPVVHVEDVRLVYDADLPEATAGVSLRVRARETVALAGVSDAGESPARPPLPRLVNGSTTSPATGLHSLDLPSTCGSPS